MLHFDSADTERAFLVDLAEHYSAKATQLRIKPLPTRDDLEQYTAFTSIVDAARDISALLPHTL